MYRRVLPLLLTAVLLLSGCTAGQKNMPQKTDEKEMTGQPSDMSGEGSMYMDTTENVIYLAGGCFWGMEQLMQSIPGVIDAESGYANGTCEADADYKTVCKGETGFREAVRVEYDPGQVSLDALLLAYFYVIDPTVENRQGNDRGSQYQTGVYYTNESAKETVERMPSAEEIAERLDMPVDKVREIMRVAQEPVSLETPIGEEEDSHLGDFIPDEEAPVPAEAASQTLLKEQLADVLKTLTPREEKVLRLRFGLEDGRPRTLEEVGKEFNVTRERIRQIEAKALRKLRHPSRSKKLRDFLD